MDYDGDGDLDILSGSYTGEVYWFERKDDGDFAQGRYLLDETGAPLKTDISITPEAHDLDGDGDLDLLIGTRSSGVFVFENHGVRTAPKWAAKGRLLTARDKKKLDGSNAHYADWDQDGVRDIVVGSEQGEVAWYRNLGSDTAPRFAPRRVLVPSERYEQLKEGTLPTGIGQRTKVDVADFDGDGKVDLLVGDAQWMSIELPPLLPEQEAARAALAPQYEAARKRFEDCMKERNQYVRKPGGIPKEVADRYSEAQRAYSSLAAKMRPFDRKRIESHGYVWFFPRTSLGEANVEARAQSEKAASGPASLRLQVFPVPGRKDRVRVQAEFDLAEGWHAYAAGTESDEHPITTVRFAEGQRLRLLRDWTLRSESVPAEDGARWLRGHVLFDCEVDLGDTDSATVEIDYQACDASLCLPPDRLSANVRLRG